MVNEYTKSNNGKLLAALAVFAMVMCALAVAVPASDAGTSDVGGEVDITLPEGVSGTFDDVTDTITLTGTANANKADDKVEGDFTFNDTFVLQDVSGNTDNL